MTQKQPGWDHFNAEEAGFKELLQLYKLVTEQLGQEAIIVDADDLLKHPGLWGLLELIEDFFHHNLDTSTDLLLIYNYSLPYPTRHHHPTTTLSQNQSSVPTAPKLE